MTKAVLYPLIATGVIALAWFGTLNAQPPREEAISMEVTTLAVWSRAPMGRKRACG
jgi:hypothetical protein